MRKSELLAERIRQAYQRLMADIFARDPRIPACYHYIIENGKEVSLEERMNQALETIPNYWEWTKENQIRLLNLRYGLKDGRPRPLREINKRFKVTPDRIRQVEARILNLLRHPSRSERLRVFLAPTLEEFQRLKQLIKENEELASENEGLRNFCIRWAIALEEERGVSTFKRKLTALASLYSFSSNVSTRVYKGLTSNAITSVAQLKAIMAIDETKISDIRSIGEKSLQFIYRVIETEKGDENARE